ncbi:hypothetical protein DFR75_103490 [Nocardia ignorata]|uniref:Uncharacterized protein n=1 Tax=Nocardia ignorata TaxID=145285 RepID=A0A4R6PM03_NOCIG|nr:hypothetical protein DFR75_103490 [Nocardia ignorata]
MMTWATLSARMGVARTFRDGCSAHQAGKPGDRDADKQFSPQYEEQI